MREEPEDPTELAHAFELMVQESSDGVVVITALTSYDAISLYDAVRLLKAKGYTVDDVDDGEITIRTPSQTAAL